jgi:chromosome segregation ATPase
MADESGSRFSLITAGLIAGLGLMVISLVYNISSIHTLDAKLNGMAAEILKSREAFNSEVAKLNEASSAVEAARDKTLAALRSEVAKSQTQTRKASLQTAGRAGDEALRRLQEINARIAQSEQRLRETQAHVDTELDGVKQAADSATTNLAAVSTEVREVKNDVASTRSQLNSTIADLRRVTGDMGVMSGLIATNGKQIDALKQLGDRNYAEFTVNKTKDPVRVADVYVLLKKADTGRNRYTIELRADDRSIEKRDRGVNEPVQFYVGNNRQPYELVVNRVQKNQIVGYLATPKANATRP